MHSKTKFNPTTSPLELLDPHFLEPSLQAILPEIPFIFEVLPEIDSTNRYLLEQNSNQLHICLAEQQTAGRGRHGKTWISPFGVNLYCSLLWPFTQNISHLAGLSLTVGVILANTLEAYGVPAVGLKWPNDIFCQNKKMAGILVETRSEHADLHKVVIGVGLNVFLSKVVDNDDLNIQQPWTDVVSQVNFQPNRNELALHLLKNIVNHLAQFEKSGFSAFQEAWLNKDILLNQPIALRTNQSIVEGIVRGVDKIGRLILENNDGVHYFSSAEIQCKIT